MEMPYATVFIVISAFLVFINLYFARAAFAKPVKVGRYLGYSALMAALVTFSYLLSILSHQYLSASIWSSVYFISIDWLLVALLHFTIRYTENGSLPYAKWLRRGLLAYAAADSLILFINIFVEVSVHYVDQGLPFATFTYELKPLYTGHLFFSYVVVTVVLAILLRKIFTTPLQYRNQYVFIAVAIVLVVFCNALFLFVDDSSLFYSRLDYSILGYSIGLYLMYWSAFQYRENDMLESLTMTIFSNLDQAIVLFDYEGKHIMHNKICERMLSGVQFRERMLMSDFTSACDLPSEWTEDVYTVQHAPLRWDYRRMRDDNGTVIGNLFVCSDISTEYDSLTGFVVWEKFQKFAQENPWHFPPPTAVVVFDIIGLNQVNRSYGREVGNHRIQNLVKIMEEHLPANTYYVRGYEAMLIGICTGHTEQELSAEVEAIVDACGESVKYGLASITAQMERGCRSIINAVERATRSLSVKKLMDPASAHSQTLTSLVRALQESDSDTEAHVRRTQRTGDMLGRRIGLSDGELSDLRLLCLLHDIGKIGIPLEILNKPGRLTDAEWAVLHSHTEKGYQIAMSSDELKSIAELILCHHESWNGKGYPQSLKGENIPLLSRIIAIVDAYDAMVNNRSYRKGKTPEQAQEELRRNSGTQFDPHLVEEFLMMLQEHPEVAVGEKTGGEEVRTLAAGVAVAVSPDQGSTVPIQFCRYLLDMDDYIIEVDPHFEELTGYTGFDVLSRRMRQIDLIPAEEQSYYAAMVNNQFAKSNIAYLEHAIRRKDGSEIRLCCMGKRYYDSVVKAFRSEIVIFKAQESAEREAVPVGAESASA